MTPTGSPPLEFQERVRRPIPIAWVGIGLLVVVALGGAYLAWRTLARPLIVGWSPAGGAQDVSSRSAVRIAFAAEMDRESVEERLEIEPPVDRQVTWEDTTLVLRPTYPLTPGQAYTVTLRSGARTVRGRQVSRDHARHFTVGSPRTIYLAQDGQGRMQLYVEGKPGSQQLTGGADLWDYAVHPEGTYIAYSAVREDGGADLWQVDRQGGEPRSLLRCPAAACTAPAWSPDGSQLAYERQDLSDAPIGVGSGPVARYIWLLDASSGETYPLFEGSLTLGRSPLWAPVGRRLAFYDLSEGAAHIYDLDSGEQQLFDTLSGVGTWGPDGEQMVLPDVSFHNQEVTDYLVLVIFPTRSVDRISAPTAADSTTPHWSPTGEWIAFGHAALADGTHTWGAQLWIMRPDGSEAQALVSDAEATYGAFAWRPDGRAIAYVRLPLEDIADPHPELWVVSLEDGETHRIAGDAVMPDWLP